MKRLLALSALLAGCMTSSDAPRFLALGDSYTIGEGVAPAEGWPGQLAARLRQSGVAIGEPETIAVTGWTTDELDAGIDAAAPEGPFDLVTLLIGVNNQYRGYPLDSYRADVRALLARAVGFAGGDASRVVAVSFPDWGVTPFAADRDRGQIAAEVDAFNAAARAEAEAAGAAWVDIADLSRTQGALVVDDRLHPSAEAYAGWVARILPAAREALER